MRTRCFPRFPCSASLQIYRKGGIYMERMGKSHLLDPSHLNADSPMWAFFIETMEAGLERVCNSRSTRRYVVKGEEHNHKWNIRIFLLDILAAGLEAKTEGLESVVPEDVDQ